MNARSLNNLAPPALFGAVVLVAWEAIVRLFHVPVVILPAPTAIFERFIHSIPTLAAD